LLQLRIASEDSKNGMSKTELMEAVDKVNAGNYPHIHLKGLMGMATFTSDEDQITKEFRILTSCAKELGHQSFELSDDESPTLSFGMSGDYELAINEGANMVRIGSLLFGAR